MITEELKAKLATRLQKLAKQYLHGGNFAGTEKLDGEISFGWTACKSGFGSGIVHMEAFVYSGHLMIFNGVYIVD